MNKKIIGYKLIKPEYVNAVISITGISVYDNPVEFINNYFNSLFTIEGNFIKSLKQAGVLDLWFEPIYEKEVIAESIKTTTKNEVKTKQIFTKEQEDYIKNLINNEIKKLQ